MPNNKISASLKPIQDTQRAVSELTQMLQQLGGVAGKLFDDLGKFSNQLGQSVGQVGQQISSQMPQQQSSGIQYSGNVIPFNPQDVNQQQLSSVANNQQLDLEYVKKQQILQQAQSIKERILSGEELSQTEKTFTVGTAGSKYEYIRESGTDLVRKVHSPGQGQSGTHIQTMSFHELQEQIEKGRAQVERSESVYQPPRTQDIESAIQTTQPIQSQQSEQISDIRGIGFNISDVPSAMQYQQQIPEITASIENAMSNLGETNKEMVMVLEAVKNNLQQSSNEFAQKMENFVKLSEKDDATEEEKTKANQELINAVGGLSQTFKQATQTEEAAKKFGGGGGDDGQGSRFDMMRRVGRGAGALTGLIASGTLAYMGAQQGLDQQLYNAELQAEQAKGGIESAAMSQTIQSLDIDKAENLIKFQGDTLFQESRYLGRSGQLRSQEIAIDQEERLRDMQKRQRTMDYIGAAKDILVGGGMTVGGFMSGMSGMGIPMGVAGVGMMLGGMSALGRSTTSSPYSAFEGYQNSLIANMIGPDNASQIFTAAQQREFAQSAQRVQQTMIGLRESEAKRYQEETKGIQGILSMEEAEQQIIPLIGRGGISRRDMTRYMAERYTSRESQVKSDLDYDNQIAEIKKESQEIIDKYSLQIRKANDLEADYREGASLGAGYLGAGYLGADFKEQKERLNQQMTSELAPLAQRRESLQRSLRAGMADIEDAPSSLGMSAQEFAVMDARMANAMNTTLGVDKMDITKNVVQMGRAGFGDVNQIMQNLSQISRVTGQREESAETLKNILADAVEAGFDKSKLAQTFTQTTAQIAEGMKITSLDTIAGQLSMAAPAFDAKGRASEIGLSMAATGIQSLENITKQTSGFFGVNKIQAAARAGFTAETGLGLVSGVGVETHTAWLDELESGNITSPVLRQIVDLNQGDTELVAKRLKYTESSMRQNISKSGVISPKLARDIELKKASAEKRMKDMSDSNERIAEIDRVRDLEAVGLAQPRTEQEIRFAEAAREDYIRSIQENEIKLRQEIRNLTSLGMATGAFTAVGSEGYTMNVLSPLRKQYEKLGMDKARIDEIIKEESDKYITPGQQKVQSYMSSLMGKVSSKEGRDIGFEDVQGYLQSTTEPGKLGLARHLGLSVSELQDREKVEGAIAKKGLSPIQMGQIAAEPWQEGSQASRKVDITEMSDNVIAKLASAINSGIADPEAHYKALTRHRQGQSGPWKGND